ncbi:MAG TPA: type II toxin-antitoxin system HicA family toxin [Thermoanaerobaculia bacterium]|nr:type II toxin-antitoxin system HicA family toxin [Thermoanaerobaculia bacterium]
MGRLRILSGKDVCGILTGHGFVAVRQAGSHIVMQKRLPGTTITVPVPNHSTLRIGTLQSIIRQSGVPRSEFES